MFLDIYGLESLVAEGELHALGIPSKTLAAPTRSQARVPSKPERRSRRQDQGAFLASFSASHLTSNLTCVLVPVGLCYIGRCDALVCACLFLLNANLWDECSPDSAPGPGNTQGS